MERSVESMATKVRKLMNKRGSMPDISTPAKQYAHQQSLGGGDVGAFREGLQGYLKGQPVATEWADSSDGQAAIKKYGLPVNRG